MASVQLAVTIDADQVDAVAGSAWLAGAEGIVERNRPDGRVELIVGCDQHDAAAVTAALGGSIQLVEEWQPVVAHSRWSSDGHTIDLAVPSNVFGDGTHATTVSCVRFLTNLVRAGDRVLDLGCGGGLLSIAAAHRGALVVALDTWEPAAVATRAHAARNGVEVDVVAGSIEAVTGQFDVCLANIGRATLIEVAPAITERTARGIVLSGLLVSQADEVAAAYSGWQEVDRVTDDGWATVHLVPN